MHYVFHDMKRLSKSTTGYLEKWPFSEARVAHLPPNLFVARENFILEISNICLRQNSLTRLDLGEVSERLRKISFFKVAYTNSGILMRKGNMGQGRGERRRGGRGKNKRMMGFLQPCILVQLSKEDRHGYDLLMGLDEFIEDARQYDPSIIYRLLRELEANNHVVSYEGDISLGPKRKMYSITAAGENLLQTWMEDLRRSRKEIDRLLDVYAEQSK